MYSFLYIAGLLISSPYWIWRAWKKGELRMTWTRIGFTAWPIEQVVMPAKAGIQTLSKTNLDSRLRGNDRIWVHAVSVGEVQAAAPLVRTIRARAPGKPIALSVTTRTGAAAAGKVLADAPDVLGPLVFPLDLPWAVSRRVNELRPAALIFIDTEIWPNLIARAAQNGVRLFLANGRISDKSFGRYRAVRFFLKPLLDRFTLFWMQSDLYAERIIAMGAPKERVRVGGNLKIDAMASASRDQRPGPPPSPRLSPPLLLAASTHPGEEEIILAAAKTWKDQGKPFRLAIAPRHPERARAVHALVESYGFHPILRSAVRNGTGNTDAAWPGQAGGSDVLLIDTIGELNLFFPLAGVVFVGGSLVPTGGHNIFEPAAFGRPVLFGPHMENFRDAETALSGRGAVRVASAGVFAGVAESLLFDADRAESVGKTAKATFESLQGASDRMVTELLEFLPS